jgi:glycosyltransferase involved in cell wall biosynthesis
VRARITQEVVMKSVTIPNFAPSPPPNIPSSGYSNYFLFVGAIEKHKGILILLELFKELRTVLDAKLIIVGAGSLTRYVQEFIAKNSLGKNILLLNFVNDAKLYSLYANSLALLLPSIWPENAPLVALEALSVGTPVIASNKGGLPEILRKVNKDFIFNNVEGLKQILLNFSGKELCSSQIKAIYESNFSPKAYINNYMDVIRRIN